MNGVVKDRVHLQSVKDLVPDPSALSHIPACDVGWGSKTKGFEEIVRGANPTFVVEVGSLVGQSALRFAELAPQAIVLCVDTWLGAPEMLRFDIPRANGFPKLYGMFLRNVSLSPYAARIYPLPQTSRNAARLLPKLSLQPDLILIDADHQSPGPYEDVRDYYTLLAKGGTLFVHDVNDPMHPDVRTDLNRFIGETGVFFEECGEYAVCRKP